jgi:hypothetical protein
MSNANMSSYHYKKKTLVISNVKILVMTFSSQRDVFTDLMKFISYSFMCSFNSLLANYKISTNIQIYIHTYI